MIKYEVIQDSPRAFAVIYYNPFGRIVRVSVHRTLSAATKFCYELNKQELKWQSSEAQFLPESETR